jgi:hypothetical protein
LRRACRSSWCESFCAVIGNGRKSAAKATA